MNSYTEKIRVYLKLRKTTLSFFGRSQYHDWRVLVVCTIICLCGAFIFELYIFSNINQADASELQLKVVHKKINKEVLTQMLQRVEEKQNKIEDLRKVRPTVIDPSI